MAQRSVLRDYTEAPIRQGYLEIPWERWMGRWILGNEAAAQRVLKQARTNLREQTLGRWVVRTVRPESKVTIQTAEIKS